MKRFFITLAAALLCHGPASSQGAGRGQEIYEHFCATCHGLDLRGDGPMAPVLLLQPPNLRELSQRHGGTFPIARVVMRIDGRDPLVSHGSPMPVYGDFFEGDDTTLKAETGQPIMTSRAIVDLMEYLEAQQE